jgi:hypothetical protein
LKIAVAGFSGELARTRLQFIRAGDILTVIRIDPIWARSMAELQDIARMLKTMGPLRGIGSDAGDLVAPVTGNLLPERMWIAGQEPQMATMSPLRRRTVEGMTIRNLSPSTQESYIQAVPKPAF